MTVEVITKGKDKILCFTWTEEERNYSSMPSDFEKRWFINVKNAKIITEEDSMFKGVVKLKSMFKYSVLPLTQARDMTKYIFSNKHILFKDLEEETDENTFIYG